ncbi:MAG: 3'-5' exonuclease [Candidatus Eremiobacteraeota bacterium]|nr:3'-5' exonuclease [Candidatus Eremiobacteraeota bacterium]
MFEPYPILVLDTETGGLNPKEHSLLTVAGIAWTPDRQPAPLFSFYVREHHVNVTEEAMRINRVDLQKVEEEGLSPKEAVEAIRYALDHHYGPSREKVMLCGHNVDFDKQFIRRLYREAGETFQDDFSNKTLDTVAIFQFFMAAGLVPPGKASGDRMFASMGIPVPDAHRHTALGDAWATALSLSRMAQSVKRGQLPTSPHSLHS